jgi:SAM-dependent methyltransferase
VGFFNWAAPIFHRSADRWTAEDIGIMVDWLRPSVAPGGSFIDVGGGTGALAARLAVALDAHATVLDPTPEMLRYVRESENVSAVLGEAETMPFDDDTFDALVITDAFHHLRDQDLAASEFARVVKLGGRVLVLDLDREGSGVWFAIWGERLLGEPAAFMTPDGLGTFMAAHGIVGESTREKGPSYRFVGEVQRRD